MPMQADVPTEAATVCWDGMRWTGGRRYMRVAVVGMTVL